MYGEVIMVVIMMLMYWGAIALTGLAAMGYYIFKSLGLYGIAVHSGNTKPWLAWIPFARDYLQGELAGEIELGKRSIRKPGMWLVGFHVGVYVLIIIFFVVMWVLTFSMAFSVATSGEPFLQLGMFMILYVLVMLIAVVASAAYMVLKTLVNFRIFKRYTSSNMSVFHAVLANTLYLYEAIIFFVFRKRQQINRVEEQIVE